MTIYSKLGSLDWMYQQDWPESFLLEYSCFILMVLNIRHSVLKFLDLFYIQIGLEHSCKYFSLQLAHLLCNWCNLWFCVFEQQVQCASHYSEYLLLAGFLVSLLIELSLRSLEIWTYQYCLDDRCFPCCYMGFNGLQLIDYTDVFTPIANKPMDSGLNWVMHKIRMILSDTWSNLSYQSIWDSL